MEAPNRVVVVGTTGSGKTTLARALAQAYNLPHTSLDTLHWRPNWQPAPQDEFIRDVQATIAADRWVMEGNYRAVREMIWERADTIVWIDLPFFVNARQLLRRTLVDCRTGRPICNGNQQRLWELIKWPDGLWIWFFRTYFRRRRQYTAMRQEPRYAGKQWIHLTSPEATREFAARLNVSLETD
jgi:adenylate kinase family enzyme